MRQLRREIDAAAQDPTRVAVASEQLCDVHDLLDQVEDDLAAPRLRQEIDQLLSEVGQRVGGADDATQLDSLRSLRQRHDGVEQLTAIRDTARELLNRLQVRDGSFDREIYAKFLAGRALLLPAEEASRLLLEGDRCLAAGDQLGLRAVNTQLVALVPPHLRGVGDNDFSSLRNR